MTPQHPTTSDTDPDTLSALSLAIYDAVLPDWPLPVSGEVNPAVHAARIRHLAWLNEFGFVGADGRVVDIHAQQVVAYAYPHADVDILTLVTDWTYWWFHFDDLLDEGPAGTTPELASDLLDFIRGRTPKPIIADETTMPQLTSTRRAHDDLWRRTRRLMAPDRLPAFTSHMDAYFDSLVAEARYRQQGAVPTVDDYCRIRRFSGPAPPQLDFVEQSESVRLPDSFYGTAEYEELVGAIADIASWTNDVFSAAKEYLLGEMHNLVIVLHHRDGGSLPDAARLAARMIAEELARVTAITGSVPATLAAAGVPPQEIRAVERWIQGLYCFLNHAAWYLHHHRYTNEVIQ